MKERVKMKKKVLLLGIAISMIGVTSCSFNTKQKKDKIETTAEQTTNSSKSDESVAESATEIVTDVNGEVYEENSDRLTDVSKKDFEEKIKNKESFWVYVGRPNCPDCQKYYPNLVDYLENNNLTIEYFNTRVKTSKKAEMVEMLANLGVDEVPAIIEFKKGEVIRVYDMQTQQDIIDFEKSYKEKM